MRRGQALSLGRRSSAHLPSDTFLPQGLSTLTNLSILDVSANRLTTIEGLEGQRGKLEDLWLNDNQVWTRPMCE